jgi:hypothetical protein
LLDGTRDISALVEVVEQAIADGRLTPSAGNPPASEAVEIALSQLCGAVLLVG